MLAEAEEAGLPGPDRAAEACRLVAGIDIHPVAVIIARVTYLLALAPALGQRSGSLSVPVFLGDSMQLSISQVMAGKELVVRVPPPPAGKGMSGEPAGAGREQLDFPETFCRDPGLFDKAIEEMRRASLANRSRKQVEAALTRITEQHYKADITREQQLAVTDLGKTYETFDRLRREGRDTIWAYVARNLSRPLAFSASGGWANVLVGNPPWVAYRHMSPDLQKKFKELAKGERVYVGGRFATQNDLSALFTVRAAHLYLRAAGRIAFVLPLAAMTRGQFEKFRSGRFESSNIAWDEAWTMDDSVVPLFPVPSCVLFGLKRAIGKATPDKVRVYSGWLPLRDASEEVADSRLKKIDDVTAPHAGEVVGGSDYRAIFRQGAILVPRMLCLVERRKLGRLGPALDFPAIESRRSSLEKEPWRSAPSISGQVEERFLRPVLLGESVLPFRLFRQFEGVIPYDEKHGLLTAAKARKLVENPKTRTSFGAIIGWLHEAEASWENGRSSSTTISLAEQLDYYGKLAAQFPIAPLRVVYAKAGTQPAACIIRDDRAVIDHMLYWTATESEDEASYLTAILNSETARSRAEHYQARGQFGARHFDKVMFNLPIPLFDESQELHRQLAAEGARAEAVAALVEIPEGERFVAARQRVRRALVEEGVAGDIEKLVEKLLDPVDAG